MFFFVLFVVFLTVLRNDEVDPTFLNYEKKECITVSVPPIKVSKGKPEAVMMYRECISGVLLHHQNFWGGYIGKVDIYVSERFTVHPSRHLGHLDAIRPGLYPKINVGPRLSNYCPQLLS